MSSNSDWPWFWSLHAGMVGSDHETIISTCQTAGVNSIEMPSYLIEGMGFGELEELERQYAEAGIRIDSFHLPFTAEDDLSNFYETGRRHAVDRIRQFLELIPALKVRVAIQHATTSPILMGGNLHKTSVDVEGFDPFLRQLGKSLDELLPIAESGGIQIALENMQSPEDGGRFCSRPEHFERLAAEFDHLNLGFCFDTGHALISVGPDRVDELFDAMAPRLCQFHLADNAGDRDSHLAPGRGLVDWNQFFRKVVQLDYRYGMCVETPPFAPGPNYAMESWQQMLEDLDEMVRQALSK